MLSVLSMQQLALFYFDQFFVGIPYTNVPIWSAQIISLKKNDRLQKLSTIFEVLLMKRLSDGKNPWKESLVWLCTKGMLMLPW